MCCRPADAITRRMLCRNRTRDRHAGHEQPIGAFLVFVLRIFFSSFYRFMLGWVLTIPMAAVNSCTGTGT
jgi:hypothetical protein